MICRTLFFCLVYIIIQVKTHPKRDVADDDREVEVERPGKKARFQSSAKSSSRSTFVAPPTVDIPEKEELLKLVEQDESGESLDDASLKRMILNFDKRVLKNQELRVKFPDAPEKYTFFIVWFYIIIIIQVSTL